MLLGQYSYTLDEKGRLTIPSRFRAELAAGMVVTRWLDPCLVIFPLQVWEEISQKVTALPITDPRGRGLRRVVFADAQFAEPDRQGRILLPDRLRQYAELDLTAEVVVVGLNSYLELWNPKRWEGEDAHQMEAMQKDPAVWQDLGI